MSEQNGGEAGSRAGRLPVPAARSRADLVTRVRRDREILDAELSEIDMLLVQARTEAARHEGKRAAAADRLATLQRSGGDLKEVADVSGQVVNLTRRALVMQAQVDVIEGKSKTLTRYRDAMAELAGELEGIAARGQAGDGAGEVDVNAAGRGRGRRGATVEEPADDAAGAEGMLPPAVSRIVLRAQEDLRRDIARTMHDGPAQSLTNIVLQAQIVERLVARDPAIAQAELKQLIAMVQQTLDATKSFIFDVRPMVLDDLGLVPTIRRAARERGRRAQIQVDFESYGADRRLPMDLEVGLFRILDETLAAYLAGHPDSMSIRLDWTEGLEARVIAQRALPAASAAAASGSGGGAVAPTPQAPSGHGRVRGKAGAQAEQEVPVALAAMLDERRTEETAARRAAGSLPPSTRRELVQRATTLGVSMEILQDGREVLLQVDPAAIP